MENLLLCPRIETLRYGISS